MLSGGFAVASGFINVKIDNWVDEMCLDTFTEIAWGVISETAFDSIAMGFDFINDKIANVYLVEVH